MSANTGLFGPGEEISISLYFDIATAIVVIAEIDGEMAMLAIVATPQTVQTSCDFVNALLSAEGARIGLLAIIL